MCNQGYLVLKHKTIQDKIFKHWAWEKSPPSHDKKPTCSNVSLEHISLEHRMFSEHICSRTPWSPATTLRDFFSHFMCALGPPPSSPPYKDQFLFSLGRLKSEFMSSVGTEREPALGFFPVHSSKVGIIDLIRFWSWITSLSRTGLGRARLLLSCSGALLLPSLAPRDHQGTEGTRGKACL